MSDYTIDVVENTIVLKDNENWLTKPLLVYTRYWNNKLNIDPDEYLCYFIEKWTSTDWASIPKFATRLLWVCPRDKEVFFPWVVHDNLYREKRIRLFKFNRTKKEIWEYVWEIEITSMADASDTKGKSTNTYHRAVGMLSQRKLRPFLLNTEGAEERMNMRQLHLADLTFFIVINSCPKKKKVK